MSTEDEMKSTTGGQSDVPKRRQRHYSYDESVDEPPKLIEDEPVEIEEEVPAEENEPLERVEKDSNLTPPEFEE
jgi:hypothetical protein